MDLPPLLNRRHGVRWAHGGGEEFTILLPGTTLTRAAKVIGRLGRPIQPGALPHEFSQAVRGRDV